MSNLVNRIRNDPTFFFTEILGVHTLEPYQVDIINAFVKCDRLHVSTCHALGKTFIMARIALYFLSIYKGCKVITTAPTHRQVEELLWGELRSAHKNSRYSIGGHLTNTKLKMDDDWFALGFSPKKDSVAESDAQQSSSFQGFHAKYVLVIFDEATGVHNDMWKMAEGLLTSGKIVKFVTIGNPTRRDCEFFKASKDQSWVHMALSCFDSPNLVANGLTDKEAIAIELDLLNSLSIEDRLAWIKDYKQPNDYLINASWVMTSLLKWGMDHPLSKSKIFGEFPEENDNSVISLTSVELALDRRIDVCPLDTRYIGVDVARFGSDKTIFYEFIGNKTTRVKELFKRSLTEVSGELVKFLLDNKHIKTTLYIDATGIGSGVYDMMLENQAQGLVSDKVDIVEVHNAFACDDSEDREVYLNLRALMYFSLADALRDSISLNKHDDNFDELTAIIFKYSSHGKLQIESKDDFKKRTGFKSPDYSDALCLANAARMGLVQNKKVFSVVDKSIVKSDSLVYLEIANKWKHLEFNIIASYDDKFSCLFVAVDSRKNKLYVLDEMVIDNPRQLTIRQIYRELAVKRDKVALERNDPIYFINDKSSQFAMDSSLREEVNWIPLELELDSHWNLRDLIKQNRIVVSDKCQGLFQEILMGRTDNPGILLILLQAITNQHMLDDSVNEYPIEDEDSRRAFSMAEDIRNELEKDLFHDEYDL